MRFRHIPSFDGGNQQPIVTASNSLFQKSRYRSREANWESKRSGNIIAPTLLSVYTPCRGPRLTLFGLSYSMCYIK